MRSVNLFFSQYHWIAVVLCVLVFILYMAITIRISVRSKRNGDPILLNIISGIIGVFVFPLLISLTLGIPDASLSAEMENIYNEADIAYDNEDYVLAAEKLDRLISMDPSNPRWHGKMAEVLSKQKDYNKALIEIDTALRKDPQNGDYLRRMGLCLYHLDRFDEARDYLDQACTYQESIYLNHQSLGWACEKLYDYEGERDAFKKAVECKPDSAGLHYCLSRAYTWLGDYSEALYQVNEALDLDSNNETLANMETVINRSIDVRSDPNNVEKINQLGHSLLALGEYTRAAEAYDRAITLDHNNAMLYHNRGYAYFMLYDYESAERDMYIAVTMDPSNPYYFSEYDFVFKEDTAVNNEEDIKAQIEYGYALFKKEKYVNTAIQFKRAKLLMIKNEENIDSIESVIDSLDAVNTSESTNNIALADVHYYMGLLMYNQGSFDLALKESNLALSFNNSAYYLDLKGCTLLELDRFAEAKTAFEKALELEPNNKYWASKLEYAESKLL